MFLRTSGGLVIAVLLLVGAHARGDDGPGKPLFMDSIPTITPAGDHPPASQQAIPSPDSYQLTPMTVTGQPVSDLHEEDRVGPAKQPRWTTERRFPGVRIYVLPENDVEFEFWVRSDVPRHGPAEMQYMYEVEFGLPDRFQLDLYTINRREGGTENFTDGQIELRWAFADWGKIWGNPTLYLEYATIDRMPDKVEVKLLIGDELARGWHWGQNFLFEAQVGGEREYEYGWTGGISKTIIDEKLSVGLEAQFSLFDLHGHRGTYRDETFIGPSIQWRPRPRMHIDIAPLIGVTGESPAAKLFLVFGYEL